MIKEMNRPWSALKLPQAQAKFSSPLFIHRVERGLACVSEDLSPDDYYWIDCQLLFGRITEYFSRHTPYHRNRSRKLREKLGNRLNDTLNLPRMQPLAA